MTTAAAWMAHGFTGLDDFVLDQRAVPAPGPGEITVAISAAGVNPADLKHVRRAADPALLPMPIGYEIAGTVTAVGPGARLGCGTDGPAALGRRVAAFRVHGGYAEALTFPAADAFVLAETVDDESAAGLLLAGCTAAELLHRCGATAGQTVVLHGASGAVGTTLLQLARRAGVVVIGTAGPQRQEAVRRFGGIPVPYGPGLTARIRAVAPGPITAALDCAGTPEAIATSLELVADRARIITVAAAPAASEHGLVFLSGSQPDSAAFRDGVRGELLHLLAAGALEVPIARTFDLRAARDALELVALSGSHGKVVLRISGPPESAAPRDESTR
ncbi:zinc-binding dehydrogenase [Gordonia alkaliphila]|uniref:quinone oxidoreductase family protein n=1 Tax=Gordonia alkaliphila TaxID=1053547 RepID=UPI001FF3576B|nr:zinc-binding dehydrogenase [Gordonia alkaliphila]MCK0438981.1 zinc-binding dehydrogenase [Gordonia alkaliphila]